MSVEDPFSVVRGEIQKAQNTGRGLYQRWCEILQESHVTSTEEFDWTTNELRNSLRSIEWDLEDLEETISIVESNPRKFKISGAELSERRSFVEQTRNSVKEMRDHISSPRALAFTEQHNRQVLLGVPPPPLSDRFVRLDNEMMAGDSRYVEDQQAQQQLIIAEQDAELELVSGSIGVLKHVSGRIGDELGEQAVMLEDFSHEMENTHTRMDSVLKRLAKVSHMTSDRRQCWAIIGLVIALLIVLILLLTL